MVLPIYNVIVKIDKDVISASKRSRRKQCTDFFENHTAAYYSWDHQWDYDGIVPALTTFVISDLLGGSKILLIGNVIEQEFKQSSNWNVGSGLSLVLMIFIIASMALIAKYDKDGEGTAF